MIGGCCGNGTCFYVLPKVEDDCCPDDEKTSAKKECCKGKKCPEKNAGNPISIQTGSNEELETDLAFPTPFEKGLEFYRTYSSRKELDSPVGYGWTHNYNVGLESVSIDTATLYKIMDESNREHFFQDTIGLGIYVNIRSYSDYLVTENDGSFTWVRGN